MTSVRHSIQMRHVYSTEYISDSIRWALSSKVRNPALDALQRASAKDYIWEIVRKWNLVKLD